MTDIVRDPKSSRRSPRAVRNATFSRKVRGIDEIEVRDYLTSLADEIEAADSERAALRAELDRLRSQGPGEDKRAEINAHAVALFSQAQQVADRLVEEAVQHARELMSTAREQQREILEKAHSAAEAAADAARSEAAAFDRAGEGGRGGGAGRGREPGGTAAQGGGLEGQAYGAPIPEIEYVRTFARVAQVQLRSVLDALTEQVDKLGQLPTLADSSGPAGSGGPAGHGAGHGAGPGGGTGQGAGFGSTPDYGDPLAGPTFPRELSSGPSVYESGPASSSDELWWQTDDTAS